MHIDKMIKKEIIGIILTTIILLTVFIGVSYASFFSVDEGEELVIEVGDIDVTFCKDVSCGEAYSNYGKVIGLQTVDGVSTPSAIYPYETTAEALESTPYIFNVENTGQMKVYFNAFLEEDTDFVPSGSYSSYTSITELYSNHVKVGVSECTGGNINTTDVDVYTFGELTNGKIIDNVEINTGEDKTYCVWTWLDNSAPNEVQETYFVANLNFTAEYVPAEPMSLYEKILADNPTIIDDNADLFENVADEESESGLFRTTDLTKTEDVDGDGTGEEVLYFRGIVENNYVVFAGYCWRIVRTNESGESIKLRYGGELTPRGVCQQTGAVLSINDNTDYSFSHNEEYDDPKYVKWVHEDGMDSNAKTQVETWYTNEIETQGEAITNLIIDEPYCNDTSVGSTSGSTTYYGAYTRLVTNESPQFKCPNASDKYTVDATKGNGKLSKPVALLTADEVVFAGGVFGSINWNFYLCTGGYYWTLSPYRWRGSSALEVYVLTSVDLIYYDVAEDNNIGLVPSVSLSSEAMVADGGTGVYNNPYIIVAN